MFYPTTRRCHVWPLTRPRSAAICDSVFFRNLIDGSQNSVWRLALEGEILQNYEKVLVFLDAKSQSLASFPAEQSKSAVELALTILKIRIK